MHPSLGWLGSCGGKGVIKDDHNQKEKGGEEGKGRWCEIMSDGGITVRNVDRLHEVVKVGEKKEASGKLADG